MSNDVVVTQKTILENYKAPQRVVPTYLVSIERGKTAAFFIAIKYDDTAVHYAKFVGFYVGGSEDDLAAGYEELVKNADISNFIEIQVPWNRIVQIRSLIYRHKPQQPKQT
jgi:hypothetical protein